MYLIPIHFLPTNNFVIPLPTYISEILDSLDFVMKNQRKFDILSS